MQLLIDMMGRFFDLNCDNCGVLIGYIAEAERCAVLCAACIARRPEFKVKRIGE